MRELVESWVEKDTSTVLFLLMHDFIEVKFSSASAENKDGLQRA